MKINSLSITRFLFFHFANKSIPNEVVGQLEINEGEYCTVHYDTITHIRQKHHIVYWTSKVYSST